MRKAKILFSVLLTLLLSFPLFAGSIEFSGGNTTVKKIGDYFEVSLRNGAEVNVDGMEISAAEISISGNDSRHVKCTGDVRIFKEEDGLTLITPAMSYDRETETLLINSWVLIQDTKNEYTMSGASLSFDMHAGIMKLEIQAQVLKSTDKGRLSAKADSIVYDSNAQTLVLNGRSLVTWGEDRYEAARISINIETEEVVMEGEVTGAVNG